MSGSGQAETGHLQSHSAPSGYVVALPPQAYTGEEISLFGIWQVLKRYRWMIIGIMLCCTGIGAAFAFLTTPIYRAEVLLASASNDEGKGALSGLAARYGDLSSMIGINLGSTGSTKDEAIAILKSRAFTDQFIEDKNLLPVLFASKWDAAAKRWKVRAKDDIPTLGDAYRLFDRKIRSVSEDRKSGMVTLSIEWKNRHQAAAWANEMVARLNKRMRETAIREAQSSINYLKKELGRTSIVDLQQGIYRLIEAQVKKIMLANVREQYAFRVIDPAVAPDTNRYVRPKRALLILGGLFGGFFLAVLVAFVRNALHDEPGVPSGAA